MDVRQTVAACRPSRETAIRRRTHPAATPFAWVGWLVGGWACTQSACSPRPAPPGPLRIAAASDLQAVAPALADAFQRETGMAVEFSFGSTGLLARQIEHGAPFAVFLSADMDTPDKLHQQRLLTDAPACFAVGHLVIWQRADAVPRVAAVSDLAREDIRRIAIANPQHAPYGRAAMDLLTQTGLAAAVQSRLVTAENVRQAQLFAQSGNVDAAIVARSLCRDGEGQWSAVDARLYKPVRQGVSVIAAGPHVEAGRRFARFILERSAQQILRTVGFDGPR